MDAISIFATLLGVVGLAGGAVGYYGKSRGDTIIKYQAEEITLRDGRVTYLEKELEATVRERDSLKEQNVTLTSLAQGSPQLTALTQQITELIKVVTQKNKL